MFEKDIAKIFLKNFESLYPALKFRKELRSKGKTVDLVVEIEVPERKSVKRLACEIKAEGFPKYLRLAAKQLKMFLGNDKSLYPVIIAPFISEEGRALCKEEGIGFLDLSGNCFLSFNDTYIEVKGNPNRYSTDKKVISIFKGKSSRILRVLLHRPNRRWTLRELAIEAALSVGQVFKVIARLEDLDLIVRQNKTGVQLSKPGYLLDAWRAEYSYKINEVSNFYSLKSIPEIENTIAKECQLQNMKYAFTLFSGASRVAPFARYNQTFAYLDDAFEIAEKLDLKKVDSGSNVVLLKPFDEGVYYGSQVKDNLLIVSNIQLYLDLFNYKGRGEEQAEFLRSQIIKF